MNKGLLSLAGLTLALAAAVPATAQIKVGDFSVPNFTQATFNLAQAYPCTIGTYPANLGIADLRLWAGVCTGGGTPATAGATPGLLCLARAGTGGPLNANCFAVIPPNQVGPCFVQAYRLIKQVPGSFKCPDVYGTPHFNADGVLLPYQYFQYGTGVRTWWALNFTQPGTRFLLEVVSVCRDAVTNATRVHKDTWIWRVVASVETLRLLIEVMHGGAVSTLEIPCILGEDMYDALVAATNRLRDAIAGGNRTTIGNAIFDMEALIVANCLFIEVLNPVVTFPGPAQFGEPAGFQPPGNLAQTVFFGGQGSAVAGIIDTIEHPCCCKLLVDLEWIAIRQGLVGQTPTLPTF